jgi:hypothetical protein
LIHYPPLAHGGLAENKENKMSNMPKPENVQRSIRVQRELDAKILKRFRTAEMSVKDAYILALQYATRKVALTPEEYRQIADETETARRRRTK